MGARILLVEDEPAIASGLCDCLRMHGYEPTHCADGASGLAAGLSGDFKLAMLDVMLPDTDGFSICEALREQLPQQAILMLTAKGSEDDILQGFRCGADDYVCKPFSLAQLMARVDALVRRSETALPAVSAELEIPVLESFSIDAVHVCMDSLSVSCAERKIDINRRDAELLSLFAREQGRIVSRRLLLRDIWGFAQPDKVETRSVDMHMVKLRKKLAHILPSHIAGIETVRGEGYRWS